jgi:hypothetical protein
MSWIVKQVRQHAQCDIKNLYSIFQEYLELQLSHFCCLLAAISAGTTSNYRYILSTFLLVQLQYEEVTTRLEYLTFFILYHVGHFPLTKLFHRVTY